MPTTLPDQHPDLTSPDDPQERAFLPGYDAAGNPDNRYLPGHPWAEADDLCGRLRDALALTLQHRPIERIERETGVYPQQQGRLRRLLNLRQRDIDDPHIVERTPGALAAAHRTLATVDGAGDLTLGCLRAGLVGLNGAPGGPPQMPRISPRHPAAVVWKAERARGDLRPSQAVAA